MVLPPGWKSFDIATHYYDSEKKEKIVYNIRWVFESKKRWDNMKIPENGAIVQLQGRFIGRTVATLPCGGMMVCLIDNIDILSRAGFNNISNIAHNKRKAAKEPSNASASPWKMKGAKFEIPITPVKPSDHSTKRAKITKTASPKKHTGTTTVVSSSITTPDEESDTAAAVPDSPVRTQSKRQSKPCRIEIPSDSNDTEETSSEDELLD